MEQADWLRVDLWAGGANYQGWTDELKANKDKINKCIAELKKMARYCGRPGTDRWHALSGDRDDNVPRLEDGQETGLSFIMEFKPGARVNDLVAKLKQLLFPEHLLFPERFEDLEHAFQWMDGSVEPLAMPRHDPPAGRLTADKLAMLKAGFVDLCVGGK